MAILQVLIFGVKKTAVNFRTPTVDRADIYSLKTPKRIYSVIQLHGMTKLLNCVRILKKNNC